jgi:hypothetical protein
MQREPQGRVILQNVQERPIAALIGLLKYTLEVPNGLVIVQYQTEMDTMVHCVRNPSLSGSKGLLCKTQTHLAKPFQAKPLASSSNLFSVAQSFSARDNDFSLSESVYGITTWPWGGTNFPARKVL